MRLTTLLLAATISCSAAVDETSDGGDTTTGSGLTARSTAAPDVPLSHDGIGGAYGEGGSGGADGQRCEQYADPLPMCPGYRGALECPADSVAPTWWPGCVPADEPWTSWGFTWCCP